MMKKKRTFLFVLSLVIVCLLYRADFTVAIAAAQNMEDVHGLETGQSDEPAAGAAPGEAGEPSADPEPAEGDKPATGAEPGEAGEPSADPEPAEGDKPATGAEPGEAGEPSADPEPAEGDKPATGAEPGEAGEPSADPEPTEGDKPATDVEPEKAVGPTAGSAELAMESAVTEEPEESVSTGRELTDWLESHKNTGGRVKLADHIVLDEDYSFCPDAPHMPAITVDTGRYTITVTGAIELLSDNQLLFSGQPEGRGIFYVEEKGLLSMSGVTVESGERALWQEEGAGLEIGSDCHISGSVHYADTPFVMYFKEYLCTVVEKGQTIHDALPERINCTVIRQGRSGDEKIPVSWHLEGTEKQQEERRRFRLQGSFSDAASMEPASCTVVYNDYPLTFTDVRAEARGCLYTFQGGFTVPEESLPFTVMAQYSFDAENWLLFEEQRVTNADPGFYIACKYEQSEKESCPNIYIRLQWNDNGTEYFSNVLCYAADNLDVMEDIGGSRGGGTSITNPPDEPREEITGTPPEEEKPEQKADCDADPEEADTDRAENRTPSDAGDVNYNAGQPIYAAPADGKAGRLSGAESSNARTDRLSDAKAGNADTRQIPQAESMEPGEAPDLYAQTDAGGGESVVHRDSTVPDHAEAVEVISAYGENGVNPTRAQTLRAGNRRSGHMAIAVGSVLLAAAAGTAGFYARSRYSRSGTNR